MMAGVVNASGEAMLRIVVGEATQRIVVDALIDTGYTGNLTLPPSTIAALNLPWRVAKKVFLAMETLRCLMFTQQQ
jgi:predicted aspartyl protease